MVEIDGEVVRLCREFLPLISGDSWDDPRASVIIGDGIDHVANAADDSYDVIIVDSTDPIGVGEVLFTDSFYAHCARVLAPDGLIVNQCGVPFMQASELRETSARRARHFAHVSAYVAAVPTYVGGFMTLGIAYKGDRLTVSDVDRLRRAAEAAGIDGVSQYWSPEVHAAAFSVDPDQPGPKLSTRLPATRCQPSISTKKMSLNGSEMLFGGSIIMPRLIRMLETTTSMTRNGR